MQTSDKGISLIKEFEGFRAGAYRCPSGVWTIGYGHTANVHAHDHVTTAQAELLLREDIAAAEGIVERTARECHGLSQCQFDALVSFTFNLGCGAFHRSTLRQKVLANPDNPSIRGEFLKWNKSGGKVMDGLTRRREAEARMYFGES